MSIPVRNGAARAALAALALLALSAAAPAPARAQVGQCPSELPSALPPGPADPFRMYVFGDSVMWGEGLRDRNKFWCRVKQWVEAETRRPVKDRLFAHAGATIDPPPGEYDLLAGRGPLSRLAPDPFGDINISFPTITQQVESAATQFGWERERVELVLLDGCINDVDFRNLLRAQNTEDDIRKLTDCKCGLPMKRLLARVVELYPNALVVVTGYFPVIFEGATDETGAEVNGTANNVAIRRVIKTLGERANADVLRECVKTPRAENKCSGDEDCRRHLARLSRVWYDASNEALAAAVAGANAGRTAPRALFARINFPADYAFSTQQSMLWNVGFGATNLYGLQKALVIVTNLARSFSPNDERFDARKLTCDDTHRELRRRVAELRRLDRKTYEENKGRIKTLMSSFGVGCRYASLGHPNEFGAALYAQAIVSQLQLIGPPAGWKRDPPATPPAVRP